MSNYDHKKIEKKWQEKWEAAQAFKADDTSGKPKQYILDMFPYPSGAGLHVGHVEGYTATDSYSRYKRMRGFTVIHPMGWDAFGLPAENYAIKTGVPPLKTTNDAIDNFRKQMKRLGFSYDWSREFGTHTPEYYKWTQWFFLFLYNNGLAEKRMGKVNWCPKDQTVLANEQVVDGCCERCGAEVVQKDLDQWFLKITEFADALVKDLDQVDWPESTKINQRNWIGKSEGLIFSSPIKDTNITIETFSTHYEAFYADTFVVIAPDHPLLPKLLEGISNKEEILKGAKRMVDERAVAGREEREVEGIFTGRYIVDPVGNGELPIWIANYALADYGTGIVKCSAHDERDFAFAKKYNIPLKEVLEPLFIKTDGTDAVKPGLPMVDRNGAMAVVKHWSEDKYLCLKWKKNDWQGFVLGGIEAGESPEVTATREIHEETGYKNAKLIKQLGGKIHSQFFHEIKKENRCAHLTAFYFELENDERDEMAQEEKDLHDVLWVSKADVEKFVSHNADMAYVWKVFTQPAFPWTDMKRGVLTEPTEFAGKVAGDFRKEIAEYAEQKGLARKTTVYKLRDWLISRQRYWGAPIPVVYDPQGKPHPVPEEHLPWMLPTDVEFKPTGVSPLGQSKELLERTEKIFGKGWKPEIDTMDTFVCSSWYYFRFADPHNTAEFANKEAIQKWLPVDLYMGGAEHTVLHLMYARFFTKALQKFGYVNFSEPFLKLRHQGLILAEDGNKMSKSKGNVVNPDDVVDTYGADSVRLYEMFMGPLEASKPWNTKNILGVRRFLERVWKLQEKVTINKTTPGAVRSEANSVAEPVEAASLLQATLETLLHQTIKKVGEDIENLKFNTVISSLMILLNEFEKEEKISKKSFEIFLQLLAPLAPHITAELAEEQGIDLNVWPTLDATKLVSSTVKVAVQINGKVRATLELTPHLPKEEALATARENGIVAKWLAEGKETQAIYVPGKIISFVIDKV